MIIYQFESTSWIIKFQSKKNQTKRRGQYEPLIYLSRLSKWPNSVEEEEVDVDEERQENRTKYTHTNEIFGS